MVPDRTLVQYTADPRVSKFIVKIAAGGPLAKLGHNPTISISNFASEVAWAPDETEGAHLTFEVYSNSLLVTDDLNDKDRREIQQTMHNEVLETAKYPRIAFVSTDIEAAKVLEGLYRIKLSGNLTLHGVTRKHVITTQVVLMGDSLRASGDFGLLQTDYGIKLYSVAAGALRILDELKFSFDIVARKAK